MQIDPAKLRLALENAPEQSSDFDLNPGLKGVPGRVLRPAAVLIGLWESQRGARLILTKRASHLQHHPGQIAFPGGKVDQQDADPEATALREAQEEIGLPSDLVQILGRLPKHWAIYERTLMPTHNWVKWKKCFLFLWAMCLMHQTTRSNADCGGANGDISTPFRMAPITFGVQRRAFCEGWQKG
jgi:hypothetical protein